MIDLLELNKTLANMGMRAERTTVVKNGVKCNGFCVFDNTNTSQIVYYSATDTEESIVYRIIENQKQKESIPDLELLLTNREYVLKHVTVAIQKKSTEKIVKKDVLNLEAFLKLRIEQQNCEMGLSTRVTDTIVRLAGISNEEIWNAALKNTEELIQIIPMNDLLGIKELDIPTPFWVITLENLTDGAVGLIFKNVFKKFCEEKGENGCLILPSSTQELVVMPNSQVDRTKMKFYAWMVDETNKEQVKPIWHLEPVVYQYDLSTNQIEIVEEL